MTKTGESPIVRVHADHPAWTAIDDDDWNGATFGNWAARLKGKTVLIWPPPNYGNKLGRFLAALLTAGAERIVAGASQPVNEGAFCDDCLPLAQDIDISLTDVRERLRDAVGTLKRLADAAEAAMSTESDMPTYESTMDEFENTLDEARQLLRGEAATP